MLNEILNYPSTPIDIERHYLHSVAQDQVKRDVMAEKRSWRKFIADNGDHKSYQAQRVLRWLGY